VGDNCGLYDNGCCCIFCIPIVAEEISPTVDNNEIATLPGILAHLEELSKEERGKWPMLARGAIKKLIGMC
jgi:hypothetical protein